MDKSTRKTFKLNPALVSALQKSASELTEGNESALVRRYLRDGLIADGFLKTAKRGGKHVSRTNNN